MELHTVLFFAVIQIYVLETITDLCCTVYDNKLQQHHKQQQIHLSSRHNLLKSGGVRHGVGRPSSHRGINLSRIRLSISQFRIVWGFSNF